MRPVLHACAFQVSLGWIALAASRSGIARIILPRGSSEDALQALSSDRLIQQTAAHLETAGQATPVVIRELLRQVRERLSQYFAGVPADLDLPLDVLSGSTFQRQVWQQTRMIPYGEVCSYQHLATRVGAARAMRAVGQALGANPVPLLVPWHRVIARDGAIGGFSDSISLKEHLLGLEGLRLEQGRLRAGHP